LALADHVAGPQPSVRFGTSGLRGPAHLFTQDLCQSYISAFLALVSREAIDTTVFVASDRRASSPHIAKLVIAAIAQRGHSPVYLGVLPTPAAASYAFQRACPSIIVTGSHIPADYNGLKFYRPDGELTKNDEVEIGSHVARRTETAETLPLRPLMDDCPDAAANYRQRYVDAFVPNLLAGIRVGVDMHSASGTSHLADVLSRLGATVSCFGESGTFVAVDTEALEEERLRLYGKEIKAHRLDCIVSTDGDGDRPLLIDELGEQVSGDLLGVVAAHYLKLDTVVTPVTSTSAIESSGWFRTILRTRVGSPYVIEGMRQVSGRCAGFEANGGFILGCDVECGQGRLERLPTRDSVLPLICNLAVAVQRNLKLSNIAGDLPSRSRMADRLRDINPRCASRLLAALDQERARTLLDDCLSMPVAIDRRDGVRFVCRDGEIIHFRVSGNAPEFRCYVETNNKVQTQNLLLKLMRRLDVLLNQNGLSEIQIADSLH